MEKIKNNLTSDINEYRRNYYKLHKKDYFCQQFTCEICKGKFMLVNKSHHNKSKKHINALNIIEMNKMRDELLNIKNNLKKLSN